jgi:stearoyl-CoA desaturase (delta-9 desaturase)
MTAIIATLVMVQLTIACVTLYLHRNQAHRGVTFNPVVEHVMRFWLWLTTGMVTRQWVAIHRRHHQKSDQAGDG